MDMVDMGMVDMVHMNMLDKSMSRTFLAQFGLVLLLACNKSIIT